jgi:hypothetical protein
MSHVRYFGRILVSRSFLVLFDSFYGSGWLRPRRKNRLRFPGLLRLAPAPAGSGSGWLRLRLAPAPAGSGSGWLRPRWPRPGHPRPRHWPGSPRPPALAPGWLAPGWLAPAGPWLAPGPRHWPPAPGTFEHGDGCGGLGARAPIPALESRT